MTDLTDRVREALNNAKDNDYDLSGLSAGEIARDLLEFDADLEHENYIEVVTAVRVVRMNG